MIKSVESEIIHLLELQKRKFRQTRRKVWFWLSCETDKRIFWQQKSGLSSNRIIFCLWKICNEFEYQNHLCNKKVFFGAFSKFLMFCSRGLMCKLFQPNFLSITVKYRVINFQFCQISYYNKPLHHKIQISKKVEHQELKYEPNLVRSGVQILPCLIIWYSLLCKYHGC